MPGKEIDPNQEQRLLIWARSQPDFKIDRSFGPKGREYVLIVNNEPMELRYVEKPDVDEMGGYGVYHYDRRMVWCSNDQARQMEAAGVLSFSEQPSKDASE